VIVLRIEYNGLGIDEDKLPNIFTMFFRGTDTMKNDTGLGLYIVKLALKKINAEIQVESEKGKGSTFTVLIPI